MKLTAKEVNKLKATIEGSSLEKLYNRLVWDKEKNIRLSISEKDDLSGFLESEYTCNECKNIIFKLTKRS